MLTLLTEVYTTFVCAKIVKLYFEDSKLEGRVKLALALLPADDTLFMISVISKHKPLAFKILDDLLISALLAIYQTKTNRKTPNTIAVIIIISKELCPLIHSPGYVYYAVYVLQFNQIVTACSRQRPC